MAYTFESVTAEHHDGILNVFNYYVANEFAAFPSRPVGTEFLDRFYTITKGYPFIAIVHDEKVVGFACLHAYHHADTLAKTAEICYFILPDHTGKGLATLILDQFINWAKEREISVILSSISSRNEGSINFHRKHGFRQVGHLENIGRKFDQDFGVVWMQLDLNDRNK